MIGQAISDSDSFTLSYTLDLLLSKTVANPIPTRKSEDSPRTASSGETPPKKSGRQYDSRDAEGVSSTDRPAFVASFLMQYDLHGLAADCLVDDRFELV
jgi:hypothetical protein